MLLLSILVIGAVFCGVLYVNNNKDLDNLKPPPLEEVEQEDEFPDDK